MNAEQLLAHYERVSEAPDAIERIKQLVLALAVRGKLVPQDSNEESSPQLVARLAAERARLVKAKVIRASSAVNPIRDEELPIQIPPNWSWLRLCQVGRISGGMTPSMNRSDYWGGEVIWLSPKDIKSDKVSNSELKITAKGLSETRLETYRPGCIFIVARSGILKRTLPVAINTVPAAANQDMKVLVPFIEGQERYLQIMFRGLMHFILSSLVKTGTTVQSLKYDEFEAQPFPIPPLAEQRRIVAKVDELMSLCDRLEAARAKREATRDRLTASTLARLNTPEPPASPDGGASKESSFQSDAHFALKILPALTTRPDQIKQLRQTVLNLAVQGKLVSQRTSDPSAADLLTELSAHRSNAIGRRHGSASPIRHLSLDRQPWELPKGWLWARFGDIVVSRDGERVPVSKEIRNTKSKIYDYYGASGVIDQIDGFLFDKPLLLIGEDGANLVNRSSPIAFIARGKYWVNNHAHVLDGLSEDFLRYIELFINAIDLKPYVTGTAQPKMNQAKMNSIPVALPPLPEQIRIVAKVDELMALCDQLEASLTRGGNTRSRLLNALLHEALAPAESVLEAA